MFCRRPVATSLGSTQLRVKNRRGAVTTQAVLGSYQYKTRVARLRLKGAHVHEFDRVLRHGSFGDDVMQLQAYLAEQGYFASEDGLSGYFGEVTGEALQAWQRDQGLHATATFDAQSKWAYLRQQEAALQQGTAVQQAVAAVQLPTVPKLWDLPQLGPVATGVLGLAALVAGASLGGARLSKGQSASGISGLGHMVRGALHSLAGATAAAGKAAQVALEPPPRPVAAQPRRRTQAEQEAPVATAPHATAPHAAPVMAPRHVPMDEVAHQPQQPLLAPVADAVKPRRLSEEELQQRIAVMKGEASPRSPPPQRPAPRKLPLDVPKPSGDMIRGSKYGTYYGGRQVREQVKQYLEGDGGITQAQLANTPAAKRLEAHGYQLSARPRPMVKLPGTPPSAPTNAPEEQDNFAAHAAVVEVLPFAEHFTDVDGEFEERQAAEEAAAARQSLLLGTELESSPEKRGRPVPVVRPGMASPSSDSAEGSSLGPRPVASSAAAPKPVPVVKPQRRATIGDMLRASRTEDDPGYKEQGALAHPATPGGYRFAPVPLSAAQQGSALLPAPSTAGSFPVNTGSSYSLGIGASGDNRGNADSLAPVQYNVDGSVVLASKPIKLVKPAHLLRKTVGYEGMASEDAAPTTELLSGDMFDGFRPHSR